LTSRPARPRVLITPLAHTEASPVSPHTPHRPAIAITAAQGVRTAQTDPLPEG